jgi:hypothetical protein
MGLSSLEKIAAIMASGASLESTWRNAREGSSLEHMG